MQRAVVGVGWVSAGVESLHNVAQAGRKWPCASGKWLLCQTGRGLGRVRVGTSPVARRWVGRGLTLKKVWNELSGPGRRSVSRERSAFVTGALLMC